MVVPSPDGGYQGGSQNRQQVGCSLRRTSFSWGRNRSFCGGAGALAAMAAVGAVFRCTGCASAGLGTCGACQDYHPGTGCRDLAQRGGGGLVGRWEEHTTG